MKKFLVSTILCSLVLGGTGLCANAAIVQNERGSISVSASANTEVAPDIAEISFAVQTTDAKSMQNATLENKKISEKVLNELKHIINPENGDFIKTSDFNASPVYSYVNSKKSFERYEVSNRVIVHTKSIDRVGEMIDKAISAGATNVSNLSFSLSDHEAQCNDLLAAAARKAQVKAGVLAKALSTDILGINTIHTTCSSNNYNAPRLYMAKNMLADVAAESAAGSAATAISNGAIKINANVNASFFVK